MAPKSARAARLLLAVLAVAAAHGAGASASAGSLVVLDPGHGGGDAGWVSESGQAEKDAVLAWARDLAALLRAQGWDVRMTRTTDRPPTLQDRQTLANQSAPSAFISLHASADGRAHFLFQRLVQDPQLNAAAAAAVAAGARGVPWELAQNPEQRRSGRLAEGLAAAWRRTVPGGEAPRVLELDTALLAGVCAPAVLVELPPARMVEGGEARLRALASAVRAALGGN